MWRVGNCGGSINDIRFEDQDDDSIAYAVSLFVSYITTSVCHINAGAHVMKLSSATARGGQSGCMDIRQGYVRT